MSNLHFFLGERKVCNRDNLPTQSAYSVFVIKQHITNTTVYILYCFSAHVGLVHSPEHIMFLHYWNSTVRFMKWIYLYRIKSHSHNPLRIIGAGADVQFTIGSRRWQHSVVARPFPASGRHRLWPVSIYTARWTEQTCIGSLRDHGRPWMESATSRSHALPIAPPLN